MAVVKIGRRFVFDIGQVDRPTTFYDSEVRGFGLRVMPPSSRSPLGARSWFIEYRPGAGGRGVAKKRLVIGSPDSLPPEKARDLARNHLAAIRLGADPGIDRSEQRAAKRLAELVPLYEADTNTVRKDRTVELYSGYWRNHVLPELGSIAARSITKADVLRLHRDVGNSHRTTANRCVTLLRHFFTWAAGAGHVPTGFNPALTVERYSETGRDRFLSHDEYARLGAAILLGETDGIEWAAADITGTRAKHITKRPDARRIVIDARAVAAIRLLALTGARLREILNLQWDHVDFQRQMLRLPDSKSGAKKIPLGDPAISILKELHAAALVDGTRVTKQAVPLSRWVIHSSTNLDQPKADLKRPWAAITRAARLNGLRIHDLRHSFASTGAGVGLGLQLLGKLLGHADPKTTNRYAHLADDPLQVAAGRISEAVLKSMAPAS